MISKGAGEGGQLELTVLVMDGEERCEGEYLYVNCTLKASRSIPLFGSGELPS